jgi:hypothetical protein
MARARLKQGKRTVSWIWGPDFNKRVDNETVANRTDTCPTLAKLFNVDATHATGQVVPGLFKPETGMKIPEYKVSREYF